MRRPATTTAVCASALFWVTLVSALATWLGPRPGLWAGSGLAGAAVIFFGLTLWLGRKELAGSHQWFEFALFASAALLVSTFNSWILVDAMAGAPEILPAVIAAVPALVSAGAAVIASLAALRAARRPRPPEEQRPSASTAAVTNYYIGLGSTNPVPRRDEPDAQGRAATPAIAPPPTGDTGTGDSSSAQAVVRTHIPSEVDAAAPLVARFAHAELVRTAELLSTLEAGGDVVYDGEDSTWLLNLADRAGRSIKAVSIAAVDGGGGGGFADGFWAGELGYRYLRAQLDAVRRGVMVRRIFIPDLDSRDEDPHLAGICEEQSNLGVDVRILPPRSVPGLQARRLFDFTLFDDEASYEVSAAAANQNHFRPIVMQTRLVLTESRLRSRFDLFEELWDSAERFTSRP